MANLLNSSTGCTPNVFGSDQRFVRWCGGVGIKICVVQNSVSGWCVGKYAVASDSLKSQTGHRLLYVLTVVSSASSSSQNPTLYVLLRYSGAPLFLRLNAPVDWWGLLWELNRSIRPEVCGVGDHINHQVIPPFFHIKHIPVVEESPETHTCRLYTTRKIPVEMFCRLIVVATL